MKALTAAILLLLAPLTFAATGDADDPYKFTCNEEDCGNTVQVIVHAQILWATLTAGCPGWACTYEAGDQVHMEIRAYRRSECKVYHYDFVFTVLAMQGEGETYGFAPVPDGWTYDYTEHCIDNIAGCTPKQLW